MRGCGTLNFRQSLFNNHRSKGLHRRARAEIRRSALAPTRKPAEARASGWMTLRRRGATTMIRRRRRRRPRRLGSCCRTRPPCCTSAFRSYPCSLSSCSTYFVEQGICATRCNVNTIQYVSQLKSTALANYSLLYFATFATEIKLPPWPDTAPLETNSLLSRCT